MTESRENAVGHVWIAGAGPGDPGLATVACVRALAEADVVLYDALAAPALLRGVKPGAELVYVGKRASQHAMPQGDIEALLVERALRGLRVVRLKGGDPFVFGRGGEEAEACRAAGVPYTIIPGVTSAIAAPAYAGIPVTHRDLAASFMVLTGHARDDGEETTGIDWDAAARAGTLIILMGVAALEAAAAALIAAGRDRGTPVACVRWGTRPDQRVVRATLGTIAATVVAEGLTPPVVTVVGDVAALAGELAWFEPGPLAGRRVVVTRARTQASELVLKLEALGAMVVEAPAIDVRLRPEELTTDERVSSRWDWIVFSSANGVEAFFTALAGAGRDARSLATTQVAAIGAATGEALRARGILADFVPSRATGAVLAEELPRVQGARILLPVSALTDSRMADALRRRGALVEQVAVYDTLPAALDEQQRREIADADAITFTSASTANYLHEALGGTGITARTKLVSIGPETSAAVRSRFGRVDAEAKEPSLDSLAEAVAGALTWDT